VIISLVSAAFLANKDVYISFAMLKKMKTNSWIRIRILQYQVKDLRLKDKDKDL